MTLSRRTTLMLSACNADDMLFAPIDVIPAWRQKCSDIVEWVNKNRKISRNNYDLHRERPPCDLLLEEMAESFYERGHKRFWRIEYPHCGPYSFEFDGAILEAGNGYPFPAFGISGSSGGSLSGLHRRSIEDANLVPNTYTHDYIFLNEEDAVAGYGFLSIQFP